MVASEVKPHQRFLPPWRFAFGNRDFQFDDLILRGKLDEIKKIEMPKNRATKLITELGSHHLDTAHHSFEVGIIAYRLAEYYYREAGVELPEAIRRKIFVGGLLHDIGKLGVSVEVLNREGPLNKKQREELVKHGEIGQIILEEADLRDFSPFAIEHHIGNSGMNHWTKKQLESRHPLVEFVSLADLLAALLDHRRKYKETKTTEEVKGIVRKKTKKGIFSPVLEQAFLKFISENKLPPYTDEDFRNDKMIHWFFDVK